jgi:hypothetical protein
MLRHPGLYRVGVSASGNHDPWRDNAFFAERYHGLCYPGPNSKQANTSLADRLEGKLLLINGEMEFHHCHPVYTLEFVRALVAANKDFDMLTLPDRTHGDACYGDPYVIRKHWDYFVLHLLGLEPPAGYRIAGPR